jgi:flagellar hook-length control protein FliK
MLDSKNIILDLGRPATSDAAGLSEARQEVAGQRPGHFAHVFDNAAATLKAAKSGNDLPPIDAADVAAKTGVEAGAEAESEAMALTSEALLFSRTLKGGTALIIGGDEPTDEGLVAFARAQGMDPGALGLLAEKNGTTYDSSERFKPALSDNLQVEFNRRVNREGASVLNGVDKRADVLAFPAASAAYTSGLPAAAAAPVTDKLPAAVTAASKATVETNEPASEVPVSDVPAIPGLIVAQPQALLIKTVTAKADAAKLTVQTLSPSNPAPFDKSNQQPTLQLEAAVPGAKTVTDKPELKINPASMLSDMQKKLHIKAETLTANGKLSSAEEQMSSPQTGRPEVAKLTIGRREAEAFLKQHEGRRHLPAEKMESITLTSVKALVATGPMTPAVAPGLPGSAVPSSFFVDTQVTAGQADPTTELATDLPVEDPRQELLRRQDDYMQLSRQLTDALGKRLVAQIQRGSWTVEMDLHPKTLGRVEVQLEMKNGELEARFIAANAATRDLINEGMPRLREAFQQHGTETAYLDLGTANQGFSDGKSTGSGDGDNGIADRLAAEKEGDIGKPENKLTGAASDEDGLNILV